MSVIVVVGLVLAILASLLLARRAARAADAAGPRRLRGASSRRVGKTLRTSGPCCDAARTAAGRWFQDWDAPPLPLAACDRRDACHCAWERNYDRRVGERRVGEERRKLLRFATTPDRRSGVDRRVERRDDWRGGDVKR